MVNTAPFLGALVGFGSAITPIALTGVSLIGTAYFGYQYWKISQNLNKFRKTDRAADRVDLHSALEANYAPMQMQQLIGPMSRNYIKERKLEKELDGNFNYLIFSVVLIAAIWSLI